jgi:hypothetical protein
MLTHHNRNVPHDDPLCRNKVFDSQKLNECDLFENRYTRRGMLLILYNVMISHFDILNVAFQVVNRAKNKQEIYETKRAKAIHLLEIMGSPIASTFVSLLGLVSMVISALCSSRSSLLAS